MKSVKKQAKTKHCGFLEIYCIFCRREAGLHKCISPEGTPIRLEIIVGTIPTRKHQEAKWIFSNLSDAHVKRPHLHVMNILSSYPLFALNTGGKHAWNFLALVLSALSLRACREAAPSTTLGSGSNYRLNRFITNSTFFHVHQREELQTGN